jgi:hypothetical protein
MIGRIWNAKASLNPWLNAYELRYVSGTKRPHSIKKIPIVVNVNGTFLKISKSGYAFAFLDGGSRLLMSTLAMIRRKRHIKPIIRQVQAKPTLGMSFWSMNGKIIPPIEPPVQAIPVAFPRPVKK